MRLSGNYRDWARRDTRLSLISLQLARLELAGTERWKLTSLRKAAVSACLPPAQLSAQSEAESVRPAS